MYKEFIREYVESRGGRKALTHGEKIALARLAEDIGLPPFAGKAAGILSDWVRGSYMQNMDKRIARNDLETVRRFYQTIGFSKSHGGPIYRAVSVSPDAADRMLSGGVLKLGRRLAESWTADPMVAVDQFLLPPPTKVGVLLSLPRPKVNTVIVEVDRILRAYGRSVDSATRVNYGQSEIVVRQQCTECDMDYVELVAIDLGALGKASKVRAKYADRLDQELFVPALGELKAVNHIARHRWKRPPKLSGIKDISR